MARVFAEAAGDLLTYLEGILDTYLCQTVTPYRYTQPELQNNLVLVLGFEAEVRP
jgi:hypothetical protein